MVKCLDYFETVSVLWVVRDRLENRKRQDVRDTGQKCTSFNVFLAYLNRDVICEKENMEFVLVLQDSFTMDRIMCSAFKETD